MENTPWPIADFVLAGLADDRKAPQRSTLAKRLAPFFAHRSDQDWKWWLHEGISRLSDQREIDGDTLRLTDRGRDRLLGFLDVLQLPQPCSWTRLRNVYLIARALGICPESEAEWKRIGSAAGLRTAVLICLHQLPLSPFVTFPKALDAWAEKLAGNPPASAKERDTMLRRNILEGKTGNLRHLLPAHAANASETDLESLRRAVINRWLDGFENGKVPREHDINDFAQFVMRIAESLPNQRFGENKIFLAAVRQAVLETRPTWTQAEFDGLLLEANRLGLLRLSRADFVSGMDPRDLANSEMKIGPSTFHFLRLDEMPPSTLDAPAARTAHQ